MLRRLAGLVPAGLSALKSWTRGPDKIVPEPSGSVAAYPDLLAAVERHLAWDQPHEEDFRFFRHLDGQAGTFVDVGANHGQSAISFRLFNHSFDIISFEPNKQLEPALALLKQRLPRFDYRMWGLGAKNQTLSLQVPIAEGINLSPSGSLRPKEFQKSYVVERLSRESEASGGQFAFYKTSADIRVFDELGIVPTIVKIDVEGWECEALAGMRNSIMRYKPLIIVELNNVERLLPMLKSFDYVPFEYHVEEDTLKVWNGDYSVLNWFCCHESRIPSIKQDYEVACIDGWPSS